MKEKIQSQFSDDVKVKGAAPMVSANPLSRKRSREEGEMDISPPSVFLLVDELRSKSIPMVSAKPQKEQWEIFLSVRRVTTSVMKIEPLSVMLYTLAWSKKIYRLQPLIRQSELTTQSHLAANMY